MKKERKSDQKKILRTEYKESIDSQIKAAIEDALDRFNDRRKDAMIFSYYKYGRMEENYDTYKCMDALGNVLKRLEKYKETKNTEFLIDIANFAMIECMFPSLQNKKVEYKEVREDVASVVGLDIITDAIEQYKETGNTYYMIKIIDYSFAEFKFPSLVGAKYTYTEGDVCDLAGFSINEIRNFNK